MSTHPEQLAPMTAARRFCAENLKQCCAELAEWRRTGLLAQGGKLYELADLCKPFSNQDFEVDMAEDLVTKAAIAFVGQMPEAVFAALKAEPQAKKAAGPSL